MLAEAATLDLSPWRFQAHPEVWLLMAFLAGSYVYAIRVIGPRSTTDRPLVTGRQIAAFAAAIGMLWLASDWPVHDIAEEYLYSVHMFQHMVLSYFVPPLVWLATPAWLFDAVVGTGRARTAARFFCRPVVAGVLFNGVIMITHIPALVNQSVSNGPLHYGLHVLVVTTGLAMWVPMVGPDRSWQMGPAPKMIYLFLMSVVPTVPAAWLTFAEGVVYRHYDIPVRVWGISATVDQQIAGAIMKTGGSIFLWTIVVALFIRNFSRRFGTEQALRRTDDDTLTFEHVQAEFGRTQPAAEPKR